MEFADVLQRLIIEGKYNLLHLGERLDLSYRAFDFFIKGVEENPEDEIKINLALGLDSDTGLLIERTRPYGKDSLIEVIKSRCISQIPIDGVIRLTTIMEAVFYDILYRVIFEYPEKIGAKNNIDLATVLKSKSIDELKEYAYSKFANELGYKGAEDYAKEFEKITTVKLNNCPDFIKYIEVKTSRDIHVHNSGIINEIYTRKVGDSARGNIGEYLEIDENYFYESYEVCFRVLEFIERELDNKWKSTMLKDIYEKALDKYGLNKTRI